MMRLRDMADCVRQKFCIDVKKVQDPSAGCKVEVDGVVCGALGLHICADRIHVTHIATGLKVASFSTLGGAMEFVGVTLAVDWTTPINRQLALDLTKLADEIEAASPRPREVVS